MRDAKNAMIYLVDDDRGMVGSISQWLSLSGLQVRAFADPTALMKVVKADVCCVVVSDIRMPGINGMELLKLIKARDVRIPVILITGHGDIPLAVEAMKSGAFEFVQKPFSPEDFLEIVQRAKTLVEDHHASAEPVIMPAAAESQTAALDSIEDVGVPLHAAVDEYEKKLIEAALEKHAGSIPAVLEDLEIPRRTLNAKMKKHGILRAQFR